MRIPSIKVRTLAHRAVAVPDDFTGIRNALLIAFERSHLIVYPPWRSALARFIAANRSIGIYALYLAGEKTGWRRRMIEIGLRMETADAHAIEHTAVAYVDRDAWCRDAGLAVRPDVPLLVITDRAGNTHAVAEGDPSEGGIRHVAAALRL